MNIDLTKFCSCYWEDDDGNKLTVDDDLVTPEGAKYYHSCFPCEVTDHISEYDYHPKGIYKLLIKLPIISKAVKNKIGKTFRPLISTSTTLGRISQDTVINMVLKDSYTLNEALWVMSNACERCSNALSYKYSDGKEGYAEYSEDWCKCNTHCSFCKDSEYEKV